MPLISGQREEDFFSPPEAQIQNDSAEEVKAGIYLNLAFVDLQEEPKLSESSFQLPLEY
jgi:hypothetical protein